MPYGAPPVGRRVWALGPLSQGDPAPWGFTRRCPLTPPRGSSASALDQEPDSAVTGDHSQMFQKMVGDSGPGSMFAIEFWSNAVSAGNWKMVRP